MITALTLTDLRSYESARLEPGAGVTVLYGPNGAGKTNVLEALSFLTLGKSLRGEMDRVTSSRCCAAPVDGQSSVPPVPFQPGDPVLIGGAKAIDGRAAAAVRQPKALVLAQPDPLRA